MRIPKLAYIVLPILLLGNSMRGEERREAHDVRKIADGVMQKATMSETNADTRSFGVRYTINFEPEESRPYYPSHGAIGLYVIDKKPFASNARELGKEDTLLIDGENVLVNVFRAYIADYGVNGRDKNDKIIQMASTEVMKRAQNDDNFQNRIWDNLMSLAWKAMFSLDGKDTEL